jgi:DNA-binding NarL/FixJ family response regulator
MEKTLKEKYNVYYVENGEQALQVLVHIPKPDIIVSDIEMDTIDGHELFTRISHLKGYSDIPFIFLASTSEKEEKLRSLKMGVIDYICKPFVMEEVEAKIYAILRNRIITKEIEKEKMENQISKVIRKRDDDKFLSFEKKCAQHKISPREKDIVKYLINGLEIKEIAHKLFLSVHTVRNHIRHIYIKCKVQNRVELLNLFRE